MAVAARLNKLRRAESDRGRLRQDTPKLPADRLPRQPGVTLGPIGTGAPTPSSTLPDPAIATSCTINMPKVLVVDIDETVSRGLAAYLMDHGLAVETARDGRGMDRALAASPFDVLIVEVVLPGEDGLSICRRLSSPRLSVILMSAVCGEVDRIVGLELGAADYLPKSCSPRELLARIRAVFRGGERLRAARARFGPTYRFGPYELDATHSRLRGPTGETTLLTNGELILLIALLERAGQPVRRDHLARSTGRGSASRSERAIDVGISRLRRRFISSGCEPMICTVSGVGYKLSAQVTRA